jgi:hypothetical protein
MEAGEAVPLLKGLGIGVKVRIRNVEYDVELRI